MVTTTLTKQRIERLNCAPLEERRMAFEILNAMAIAGVIFPHPVWRNDVIVFQDENLEVNTGKKVEILTQEFIDKINLASPERLAFIFDLLEQSAKMGSVKPMPLWVNGKIVLSNEG